jgi:hypothetical protein
MPEVGDTLRLYFPTEIDDEGYTISAVHLNTAPRAGQTVPKVQAEAEPDIGDEAAAAVEEPRTDPNYKVISNAEGKTIVLCPNAIYITCEGGSVMIEDGVGITIVTNYDVTITGKQNVSITSLDGEVSVIGKDNVSIEQEDATVELSEQKVTFKGAEVRTQ